MTSREYLFDNAQGGTATIVSVSQDPAYVVLDRTWLHVKGGGQKSDRGTVGGTAITDVLEVDGEIRHVANLEGVALHVGDIVEVVVDSDWRLQNSRLHSGGHLVAQVVEDLSRGSARAVAGHHWPGEARVDFTVNDGATAPSVDDINAALARAIQANAPIRISGGVDHRLVQIGDGRPVPCGGTHVRTTGELNGLKIRKVKAGGDRWRISYDCLKARTTSVWPEH